MWRLCITTLCLLLAPPAWAQRAEIAAVEAAGKALTAEVRALQPVPTGALRSYEVRQAEAESTFAMGDTARAQLLLMTLVGEQGAETRPGYAMLLAHLAEAAFQNHDDRLAERTYLTYIARPDAAERAQAAGQLIALADRREAWQHLPQVMAALQQAGPLPAEVAYAYARSLLLRGRAAEAAQMAAQVPEGHVLTAKAAYLRAVATLQGGDVAAAQSAFASLSQGPEEDVGSLAVMDEGRIFADSGAHTQALASYERIPRTSRHYEDALYETTWIHVRQAGVASDDVGRTLSYRRALNNMDLLVLDPADPTVTPQVRLLAGNIDLNLAQYEGALASFNDVVAQYAPQRDAMEALSRNETRLETLASTLAAQKDTLPALALNYLKNTESFRRASIVSKDLDDTERELEETTQLLQRIGAALTAGNAIGAPLAYGNDAIATAALQTRALVLRDRLVGAERQLVAASLTPEENSALAALRAEWTDLQPQVSALPTTVEAFRARANAAALHLDGALANVFALKWGIDEAQAQLGALRAWYDEHPGILPEEAGKDFQTRLNAEIASLRDVEAERTHVGRDVDMLRATGVGAAMLPPAETALRARWGENVARQSSLLASAMARLPEAAAAAAAHASLDAATQELTAYAAAQLGVVRQDAQHGAYGLAAARAEIASARTELQQLRPVATATLTDTTLRAVRAARDRFVDVVLRANVGIVDVAWALKEEQTQALSEQVTQQNDQLQVLDDEFKDVMGKN